MKFENLKLVSFVGIDKQTDFDQLLQFNNFYEFGVLHSEERNGKYLRYPDHQFSLAFLQFVKKYRKLSSLHLCGNSIIRYLNNDLNILE